MSQNHSDRGERGREVADHDMWSVFGVCAYAQWAVKQSGNKSKLIFRDEFREHDFIVFFIIHFFFSSELRFFCRHIPRYITVCSLATIWVIHDSPQFSLGCRIIIILWILIMPKWVSTRLSPLGKWFIHRHRRNSICYGWVTQHPQLKWNCVRVKKKILFTRIPAASQVPTARLFGRC